MSVTSMPTGWISVCSNSTFHWPRSTRFFVTRDTRLVHPLWRTQLNFIGYVIVKHDAMIRVSSWLGR